MADMMMYGSNQAGGDLSEENSADFYGNLNNNNRQRFPGLYVGNLTWWTTDQDVINNIIGIGVNDVQEVKFFENRNNGQSKGFCVVTFGSETSLPIVMEKLPKTELHGQNPMVTPYNRQNLNLFESQTKARPQINSNNGPNSHAAGIMGISSISGVHAGTQGLPYSANMNNYNQPPGMGGPGGPGGGVGGLGVGGVGVGGPRVPSYHNNMRMQMRPPRPVLVRGQNLMNNGPGLMPRMPRFMQPQGGGGGWNNNQNSYNSNPRMPQVNMDLPSRLGLGIGNKQEDGMGQQEMMSNLGSQSYYTPHHSSGSTSQADHYKSDLRDHRDLRDDRDRRLDDRPSRQDDRSLRHNDDRSIRPDDRSLSKHEERSSSRRGEERSSRRGGEERGSSSSRRDDSRRDERSSSRREKEPSSSSRREKSHRSDERVRSRSRERVSRERDRSRDRKERRERRDRY